MAAVVDTAVRLSSLGARLSQHSPVHFQVDVAGDAAVRQVVQTPDIETQILGGDDHVVMLDDDVVGEFALTRLLDVALQVVVGHGDLELQTVDDVVGARVRLVLRVDLAVEHLRRLHVRHHLARLADDRHCRGWPKAGSRNR